jgi:hypothetical protein
MWSPRFPVITALFLVGCVKNFPDSNTDAARPQASKASAAELKQLAERMHAVEKEAGETLRQLDEAMWGHWTSNAPLDRTAILEKHAALFSNTTLSEVRRAREIGAGPARALGNLENWLLGEALAKALKEHNQAVASLEASATFSVDGREYAWRELHRLLANELSAVRRRALWNASADVAGRLGILTNRRDLQLTRVLTELGVPSQLELAAQMREVDLEALAQLANDFLERSDAAWAKALRTMSEREIRLPPEAMSRADLPRALRAPPSIDAAFPKTLIVDRAVQTQTMIGWKERAGLTIDLTDRPQKNPLPLVVAPTPIDVRMSFRALGGLRDQSLLLGEFGTAIAMHAARTGSVATERLGDPASAEVLARLFASLPGDETWLESIGIPSPLRLVTVETWRAHELFELRRAAGALLMSLEHQAFPDEELGSRAAELTRRIYGLQPLPSDEKRWRVESDDSLRSASHLKAALIAAALRQKLGARWWTREESGKTILDLWSQGTTIPVETRVAAMRDGLAPLLESLGAGLQ